MCKVSVEQLFTGVSNLTLSCIAMLGYCSYCYYILAYIKTVLVWGEKTFLSRSIHSQNNLTMNLSYNTSFVSDTLT